MFRSIQIEKVAPRCVVVNPNTHIHNLHLLSDFYLNLESNSLCL